MLSRICATLFVFAMKPKMLLILLVAVGLVVPQALRAQEGGHQRLGGVSTSASPESQALQLTVFAIGVEDCGRECLVALELSFADSNGRPVGPHKRVELQPGQAAALDFQFATLPEGLTVVRPVVAMLTNNREDANGPVRDRWHATAEIVSNKTGLTLSAWDSEVPFEDVLVWLECPVSDKSTLPVDPCRLHSHHKPVSPPPPPPPQPFCLKVACTQILPAMIGLTSGQKLRVGVVAFADKSLQLSFVDFNGKPVGPSKTVHLLPGQSAFLDLDTDALLSGNTGTALVDVPLRVQVRPIVTLSRTRENEDR